MLPLVSHFGIAGIAFIHRKTMVDTMQIQENKQIKCDVEKHLTVTT